MDNTKLVTMAVTIAISIIVVATILAPAVNDATILEHHDQASGDYVYGATNEFKGQTYSLSGSNLLYNGETVGSSSLQIISDHFVVIFYNGTLSMHDSTVPSSPAIKSLTINADKSYSWVTTADVEGESTQSLEWFAGPSTDADSNYVLALGTNAKMQVNSSSNIMGGYYGSISDGNTTLSNTGHIISFAGTLNNMEANGYIKESSVWVEKESTIELTATDNDDGSYSLTGTTAEINVGAYSVSNATAFTIYTPRAYTTIEESPFNSILVVIPVIVIIGILMVAVGFIVRRGE